MSTKVWSKDKGKEEDIDLDEDIVILNWDISTFNLDQMNMVGELLHKKAKQSRANQVLEDVKNILVDALSTKVDNAQPILV